MRCLFPRVVVLLLTVCGPLQSAEVLELDLVSAVRMALEKNFEIRAEKFTPQIARARQVTASGRFDPVAEVSVTYDENNVELRTLNNELQTPTALPGGVQPDLFALSTGLEVDTSVAGLTPWGLTYDFGASTTRNTDTRNANDRFNSFVGLNVAQPLLRGFGTDVNLAQLRIARADRAISEWTLRQRIIDVVTDTINTYCELFFTGGNLEVEERSRDLAARLLDDNLKRAEIGVMSPLDVVQARADLAARDERVLVAQRAMLDNENFLKQLVTDEVFRVLETRVQIATLPEMPGFRADPDRDFPKAFQLRPDYRQALLDLQKRQINVVFARNQTLPRLDLVASFGVNGIDTNLADSVQRATGQATNNYAWTAGVVASLPVPNREASGRLAASKLETAQALVELKRLEQAILVEADNAAGQIETTRKRIEASRAALDFSRKTLEAAQARLASGTTTTFEVLQFQRDLAAAEISEIRARADHIRAIADYNRVTGLTLEKNGIALD
ncbi:MAG: TolC family protein [Terrimicrobiaceae bacterium]|nr:TolC family protein [Terrimicrobiaceae bacterium]